MANSPSHVRVDNCQYAVVFFSPGTAFFLQMLNDKTFKKTSRFGLYSPNISGKLQYLIASS